MFYNSVVALHCTWHVMDKLYQNADPPTEELCARLPKSSVHDDSIQPEAALQPEQ